jgi:hypothetical protein
MARKFRNKVLLAKIESEYGTDSVPTGAANAILTRNLSIQTMQGQTVEREVDRATYGHFQMFHTGPHTVLSFDVEAAGSGTPATPPAYGPLLRACGLAQTINTTVSVEYNPISAAEESVTLYYWQDGIQHRVLGARGSFTIGLSPGELPYFRFTFTGKRAAPTDVVSIAGVSFAAFRQPQAVNNAFTGEFEFSTYTTATLTAFEVDMGQDVQYRNVVGNESVQITDRRPGGSITLEEPLLATFDLHEFIACHDTGALSIRHGASEPCEETPTADGKVIEITAPKVQLVQPQIGDSQGIATIQMGMRFLPNLGNDEIKILTR